MSSTNRTAGDGGVVVVSNRGPISFGLGPDGTPVPGSPGGGLAATLGGGVRDGRTIWVAAAMTDGDRAAAGTLADEAGLLRVDGYCLRLVDLDPAVYDAAYNRVANEVLWFWHHQMFDLTRHPVVDPSAHDAWDAYRAYNQAMADAAADAAPRGATVLVHDYHLALVPAMLRERRRDVRISHFTHTPWVDPSSLHVLPSAEVDELLNGMRGADAVGFHSRRWADAFKACCAARNLSAPPTFVAPAAADHASIVNAVTDDEFDDAVRRFDALVGERRCIVRVDRMEPSKNLLRGFHAFDTMLDSHPELCGEVTFVAIAYPSRTDLDDYLRYAADVEATVADINERWRTPDWTPIELITEEGLPRAVAAMRRADVVLVNPIRDGLNLVAYEAQTASERDAVLVLSHEAGAWDDLGRAGAIGVNPFDVCEQAEALHRALTMQADERRMRATSLRRAATARTPKSWLAAQVRAAANTQLSLIDLRTPTAVQQGRPSEAVG